MLAFNACDHRTVYSIVFMRQSGFVLLSLLKVLNARVIVSHHGNQRLIHYTTVLLFKSNDRRLSFQCTASPSTSCAQVIRFLMCRGFLVLSFSFCFLTLRLRTSYSTVAIKKKHVAINTYGIPAIEAKKTNMKGRNGETELDISYRCIV